MNPVQPIKINQPHSTASGQVAFQTPLSNTKQLRRMTLSERLQQQTLEMGLQPLPLEPELLLKRVADGGHSGQFLADAFLSAYRTNKPFLHSLGELLKLDPEGFRLFHEILHIRHIPGWSDDVLYRIEQKIMNVLAVRN